MREKTWFSYYLKSTSGVVGGVLVLIMVVISLLSAFGLTPHDPLIQDQSMRYRVHHRNIGLVPINSAVTFSLAAWMVCVDR